MQASATGPAPRAQPSQDADDATDTASSTGTDPATTPAQTAAANPALLVQQAAAAILPLQPATPAPASSAVAPTALPVTQAAPLTGTLDPIQGLAPQTRQTSVPAALRKTSPTTPAAPATSQTASIAAPQFAASVDAQAPAVTTASAAPKTRGAPSAAASTAEAAPAANPAPSPAATLSPVQADPTNVALTQPVSGLQATGSSPVASSTTTPTPAVGLSLAAAATIQTPNSAAPAVPASTGSTTPSAPPAHQVAAALVQISQSATGGTLTLRLDPAELGHVQIHIARSADGTSTVNVSVERPETLRLLMLDQPQLHRTLDNAGLPQDGRSLTLSLATPDPASNASPDFSGGGGANMGGSGFSNGGSSGQQGGAARQDRTPYAGPAEPTHPTSVWLRAGVDITA